jgi:energy-coupling factor transporter ATP-binding protein EcfA2
LIQQRFHTTINADARGLASEGQGKLALVPHESTEPPLLRLSCRDAFERSGSEQAMLASISDTITSAGYGFSHALVVTYYVSLKTNPFVILSGATGQGKTEFVQLFASALIGQNTSQYALIPGSAAWPSETGEDSYYRSLQERFSSLRFLELLQEAADPGNAGKVYLVCFDALHPNELDYYFASLLQVSSTGEKRLNLPGFPAERQPLVPPNVYMTATVNGSEQSSMFSRDVLRHAGLIEFRTQPGPRPLTKRLPQLGPPPVGYQRLWLRSSIRDFDQARKRLEAILGADRLSRLHSSPELAHLLWRGGVVLNTRALHDLTTYIANSFDEEGRGLFDPHDPWRNACVAFDAQVIQRVLWRLRDSDDSELRHDLAAYLDRIAHNSERQAVA